MMIILRGEAKMDTDAKAKKKIDLYFRNFIIILVYLIFKSQLNI